MFDQSITTGDYNGQIGDGGDAPTIIENNGDEERCPYCWNWYTGIGQHWSRGSCSYPPMSQYKKDLMKGMALGDGYVDTQNKNPCFVLYNTNVTFLEWLQTELGWLGNSVRCHIYAKDAVSDVLKDSGTKPDDCLDMHLLSTKSHPEFDEFGSWYDSGEIIFPVDLSVSPITLKVWYVSDGSLNYNCHGQYKTRVEFTSLNESERPTRIKGALEEHGFTVRNSGQNFALSTEDTEEFFNLIGDPLPGFEYKWVYDDWDTYQMLKEETRRIHCTQTLK